MSVVANPYVQTLTAYVPGEQPREPGFVKLNTNENPYPPAPQVAAALAQLAADGTLLNKYPDPWATQLRTSYGELIGFPAEQIVAGNGSDEILRMIFEAFMSPGEEMAVAEPTYVLYETLASMFGVRTLRFPMVGAGCALAEDLITADVKLVILPNPNPPYGTLYDAEVLERLVHYSSSRLVVIDEAYIDFTANPRGALDLALRNRNVIVTRTFSKGWSLAGARIGFGCMCPDLFKSMAKVKDSYNINRLTQHVACAALSGADYHKRLNAELVVRREETARKMIERGFAVPHSGGNFVFAKRADAAQIYEALKARKVLVRYFDTPTLRDGMRITIGTEQEMDAFFQQLDEVMKG